MPVEIRTPYDGKAAEVSHAASLDFTVKKDAKGKVLNPGVLSQTRQSDKDGTDINLILAQAAKNGGLIMGPAGTPIYGDFSNVGNWFDIKRTVAHVEASFRLLPADIRNRFDNDPAKLIEFLSDPANDAEAVKLKLKPEPELTAEQKAAAKKAAEDAAAAEKAKAADEKAANGTAQ